MARSTMASAEGCDSWLGKQQWRARLTCSGKRTDYTITLQELTLGHIVHYDGLSSRWLMRSLSIETGGLAFFRAATPAWSRPQYARHQVSLTALEAGPLLDSPTDDPP
jgi:hypothetical protein